MKPTGFTLIELLIVVGIIAILAAIAVPNFLEAQTRAKVAGAWSDLRTVAVAVLAYAVDANRIPLDGDDASTPGSIPYEQRLWYRVLTTPVAYLAHATQVPATLMGLSDHAARLGEPDTPATFVVWRWEPDIPDLVPQRIVIRGRTVYDREALPTAAPFGRTAAPVALDPEA